MENKKQTGVEETSLNLVIDPYTSFETKKVEPRPELSSSNLILPLNTDGPADEVSHAVVLNLVSQSHSNKRFRPNIALSQPLQKSYLLESITGLQLKEKLKSEAKPAGQLIRSLSLIFLSECEGISKPTAAAGLAEVHHIKLPSFCLSRPHSIASYSTNTFLPPAIVGICSNRSVLQRRKSYDSYFASSDYVADTCYSSLLNSVQPTMEIASNSDRIEPSIHSCPHKQLESLAMKATSFASAANHLEEDSRPSHLILIPSEDKDGHHQEILQKVYVYPKGSVMTVVEKPGHRNIPSEKLEQVLMPTDAKTDDNFYIKKKGSIYSSHSSIASSRSSCAGRSSSNSSMSALSKVPLGASNGPVQILGITKPKEMLKYYQGYENETLSDISSNVSTLSDLSGYEDEYAAIRRVISDAPATHRDHVTASQSVHKTLCIETKLNEQSYLIRSLQTCKEDLEIQVHRLSVQMQNALREKEVCQEQLDILQTRISETEQKEHFEILKDKATLEGQYETLKQEYENCSFDKCLLQSKVLEVEKSLQKKVREVGLLGEAKAILENQVNDLERETAQYNSQLNKLNSELQYYKNKCKNSEAEFEEHGKIIADNANVITAYKSELASCKENNERMEKYIADLKLKEEQDTLNRKTLEKKLTESIAQITALKENQEWSHSQIQNGHKLQADLQKQLSEAKGSLSVISADRDRCRAEIERLNSEIEENRVRAVREKSTLLVHLEELEADMKERESALQRHERDDKIIHVKLSEERFQRLEDDHKKYQKLRIEIGDIQRRNECLMDELQHKKNVQRKTEEKLRDLQKNLAITQEKIGEKEVFIASLSDQLKVTKNKLDDAFQNNKERETVMTQLREEKVQLEAAYSTAVEEKNHVNFTITKLKEDMNKLSSNYYRMKHDIVAKERQIQLLLNENGDLKNIRQELEKQLQNFTIQNDHSEKLKNLQLDINALKSELDAEKADNSRANNEISSLKKSLASYEVEKNAAEKAAKLRDEQIANLQSGIETYKEKLLQVNEELFTRKDHAEKTEKSYTSLKKQFTAQLAELQALQLEKEDFTEMESRLKKTVTELKENLKLERVAKNSCERKCKKIQDEIQYLKSSCDRAIENLNQNVEQLMAQSEFEKSAKERNEIIYSENLRKKDEEIESLRNSNKELLEKNTSMQEARECSKNELNRVTELSKQKYESIISGKDGEILELQRQLTVMKAEKEKLLVNNQESPNAATVSNSLQYSTKKGLKYQSKKKADDRGKEHDILKRNISDLLEKIKVKDRKINALNLQIAELSDRSEIETLKSENSKIAESFNEMNRKLNMLQEKLNVCENNYVLKEGECLNWKMKYEGLCDFIPQRDTSIQQAVTLHTSHYQKFSSQQSRYASDDSTQDSEERSDDPLFSVHREGTACNGNSLFNTEANASPSLSVSDMDSRSLSFRNESAIHDLSFHIEAAACLPFASTSPPVNIEDTFRFSQTMADLQNQVSLAAQALQSKDKLINDLKCQLMRIPVEIQYRGLPNTTSQTHSFDDTASDNIRNALDKYGNDLADCLSQSDKKVAEIETKLNESQVKITELSNVIKEKDTKLSELHTKLEEQEREQKAKQRRYESNIRLLTRKLKEHMKGRRLSEKDFEVMSQESKRQLEGDERQYRLLKERCIETEKQCQQLEMQLSSSQQSRDEAILMLEKTKKELDDQKVVNLNLQKDLGQMEELRTCLSSCKSQISSLENQLQMQTKLYKEISDKLEYSEGQRLVAEKNCKKLASERDELKLTVSDLKDEVALGEDRIKSLSKDINDKCYEISVLQETVSNLQSQISDLENVIIGCKKQNETKTKEIEILRDENNTLMSRLDSKTAEYESCYARKNILEEDVKLKEEVVETVKEELKALNYQLVESEKNHATSMAVLNTKLISATEVENSLIERLKSALEQKLFYQTQTTELRTSLNSALSQLRSLKRASALLKTTPDIPSPLPLDTSSLAKLMDRCSEPPSTSRCLNSLTERLSSLRQEVSALQGEIKSRDQECSRSDHAHRKKT